MNKSRRKALSGVITQVETIKAKYDEMLAAANALQDMIDEAKSNLEALRDEEQDSFDNLPESLQDAERGQDMQAAISNMETAMDAIEELGEPLDAIEVAEAGIDDIITALDEARGPE